MKAQLAEVLEELKRLESIFHWPAAGMSRADLERMTVDDFWEVGASGRRYERSYVLDELERRQKQPQMETWETRDFACRKLAEGIYLLSYTLAQSSGRVTRRATIWQKFEDGWKIVFHQGTVVEAA